MDRTLFFAGIVGLCLALSGCPDEEPAASPPSNIIPMKGDPLVFIEGRALDKKSGIPLELFSREGTQWNLMMTGFQEGPQIDSRGQSWDEIVDENEGPAEPQAPKIQDNLVLANDELLDSSTLRLKTNKGFSFEFEITDSAVFLKDIFDENGSYRERVGMKVQHYSTKNNGKAFSILVSFDLRGRNNLTSYTFVRTQDSEILSKSIESRYKYMWGPGVAVGWDPHEDVNVKICGSGSEKLDGITEQSVGEWKKALEGRLHLRIEKTFHCPPFSDLNTLTIQLVPKWVIFYGPRVSQGQTLVTPDLYRNHIVDADVMIYPDEIRKYWQKKRPDLSLTSATIANDPWTTSMYRMLNLHEFGHALGLSHKMKGPTTVMNYDWDVEELQEYDVAAAQALYPAQEQLTELSDTESGSL